MIGQPERRQVPLSRTAGVATNPVLKKPSKQAYFLVGQCWICPVIELLDATERSAPPD